MDIPRHRAASPSRSDAVTIERNGKNEKHFGLNQVCQLAHDGEEGEGQLQLVHPLIHRRHHLLSLPCNVPPTPLPPCFERKTPIRQIFS